MPLCAAQTLELWIGDSPMTGRTEVGRCSFPLSRLVADDTADVWLPVESSMPGEHAVRARRACRAPRRSSFKQGASGVT